MEQKIKSPKDKYILFAFIAFFAVIATVDGFFIYKAVTTQPGVVAEKAYEKGLQYDELLEEARSQPVLKDKVYFQNNILHWDLNDKNITDAKVSAKIIRPIQEGHDFYIDLATVDNGIYQATVELPFKGLWEVKLEAQWDNHIYKTTHQFIVN